MIEQADEARIEALQPGPIHEALQRRAGCEVLDRDVGAGNEAQELCRWRTRRLPAERSGGIKALQSRVEIERRARLAAVPHDEASLAQVRSSGRDEAHNPRSVIAEEHRRQGRSRPGAQIEHRQSIAVRRPCGVLLVLGDGVKGRD